MYTWRLLRPKDDMAAKEALSELLRDQGKPIEKLFHETLLCAKKHKLSVKYLTKLAQEFFKGAFLESESASTVESLVRAMVEHARADTLSLSADKEQGEMEDGTIVTSLDWSADDGSAPGNLSFVPKVKQYGC